MAESEIDLQEFVCSTVAQACSVDRDRIDARTNLLDLGIDSLTLVSVFAQIEAVYDVELTPDEILSMLEAPTIADLVVCMERLLQAPRSASNE